MSCELDAPPIWELEAFWAAVERDVAAPDPAELEAFRAADHGTPALDPVRAARLRAALQSAVARHPGRSYPYRA